MHSLLKHILFFASIFLFSLSTAFANKLGFVQNKGQWHDNVFYRAELHGGYAYLDKGGMTFLLLENGFNTKLHDWVHGIDTVGTGNMHALKIKFEGANFSDVSEPSGDFGTVNNYFLGNDQSRWASKVKTYERVRFSNIYPGIDVAYGSSSGHMKYDFIVAPNANPNQISVSIDGAESIQIIDHELVVTTSVGQFKELIPFAYQLDALGRIDQVECEFVIKKGKVRYRFPNGYDQSRELIIDPELTFSTYIGSQSSNFGFTASYDSEGNLYAGAIVFGANYPLTSGVVQSFFGAGTIDCGISKFNSDGTDLVYSTYLGGSGNESPHSIVVIANNELYILGTTSSSNFPVSTDAYQPDFMGGQNANVGSGYSYSNGSDIFVTVLNADATDIIGSTFVGGSANDGIGNGSAMSFNYGDDFRGEIVVDDAGCAYVASVTSSSDFPIVNGYASSNIGAISGVVFKLSPTVDQLIWSTFSGGSSQESAFSLQLASDNSVYFAGGTGSLDLPVSSNAYQDSKAGNYDGYIGHISADGSTLLSCTYNGTSQFDQNYFVQIDTNGDIYVIGQSRGDYPVSSGVYSNANSGQYIQKFSPDLSTSEWSTTIGSGNGDVDISPSAFLVTDCGQIYVSGWAASFNPAGGSTTGLPFTDDAYQTTTDGSDFYIMILDDDAASLVYATYFGGNDSQEHVDGGTSRFDKNGTVYQAVCAGCGGNDDFPSQPGVWSNENPSNNCNLGVFKFELSSVSSEAGLGAVGDILCPGTEFTLTNDSEGADTYYWDFGDGNFSSEQEPVHLYTTPGEYTIKLLATDSEGCFAPDSVYIDVIIDALPDVEATADSDAICPGETIQLNAEGAVDWDWYPNTDLSNPNVANPIFTGTESTDYMVVGSTICGLDTAYLSVTVGSLDVEITEDQEICPGESVQLQASGGLTYSWIPTIGLSDPTIENPIATPEGDITYAVSIVTHEGCDVTTTVEIDVLPPPPELEGKLSYVSCNGSSVQLNVEGAMDYTWSPSNGLSSPLVSNPVANPVSDIVYTVTGSNPCGSDQMEVEVFVNAIEVSITTDSIVCYNTPFYVEGHGGVSYIWQPDDIYLDHRAKRTQAFIENTSTVSVTGFDSLGCHSTASVLVHLYPREIVRAGNDRVIFYGESVELESFSAYPISWEESPFLSCLECNYPVADPLETTRFYALIETPYGCNEIDSVLVSVHGNMYVPNSFTPNGDGINDLFKAKGVDIRTFKMEIFDRWGTRVFVTEDIDKGWNGSLNGGDYYCPPDVYQYRVVATELYGELFEFKGIVTLLR